MATQLEERLRSIEARLSRIEQQLNLSPEIPQKMPEQSVAETPIPLVEQPSQFEIAAAKPGNWLGVIAIICFIVAAGFIIKLSIDTGWLTPIRQIGLAYLLGVVLVGVGLRLLRTDREYASLLPAAGVIILYLTTFAAHQVYPLISFQTGILLTVIISAFCIWLYWKIRHDVYAITAAAGVYLAPILLGFEAAAVFSLYFFIVCSLAFAIISIWMRSRVLTTIAAYLAILVTGYIGLRLNQDGLLAIILAIHFLIFSVGSYLYSLRTQQPLTEYESWSFFPVLLVFYALEYYFLNNINPHLAPWAAILIAALLVALYLGAEEWFQKKTLASRPMILAFATIVAFHAIYIELLPDYVQPWLFVAFVFIAALLPNQFYNQTNYTLYTIPILAVLVIVAVQYTDILVELLQFDVVHYSWLIVAFVSVISLWFLFIAKRDIVAQKDEYGYGLLSAAHLLAITAFYRLTNDSGSLAVSASWLLYAILVMAVAFYRKDKVMATSALVVLSIAAAKALLYDAASAPTIVRILCLLVTGAVLYGAGFLMRKITHWKTN